jgi:hypothetical protein
MQPTMRYVSAFRYLGGLALDYKTSKLLALYTSTSTVL